MADDVAHSDFESGLKPLWTRAQAGDEAAYHEALGRIADRLRRDLGILLEGLPAARRI